jgi:hypothetical protein
MIFLISNIALSSGKIRFFEFKYEKFEFLSGDVVLELPGKSNRNMYLMYYKVLVDEYIDLTLGHAEISVVEVKKYKGQTEEKLKNKLVVSNTKYIYPDNSDISRTAFWYGRSPVVLRVSTAMMKDTFSTEAEKQDLIRKDDEIFEHIVESFRYRKEDGTYAKPEIIRQKEEVKEIESQGVSYDGKNFK